MKTFENSADHPTDVLDMLASMEEFLTNVLQTENLCCNSREKLLNCVATIEKITKILGNDSSPSETFLKPLHTGLSRSLDSLNAKPNQELSQSRSMTNLGEQYDIYDSDADDEINNINNLKENYLQVVEDVYNNHEINGDYAKTEAGNPKSINPAVNGTKPEVKCVNNVNYAKPEVNSAKPEVAVEKKTEAEVSKRRRKRDSSTLFDISLDDLTEPDHSGFLREKHSGKEWWCVLQDQHLCMFPSQNPQELAYDVLLVPCCEISLDDIYTETPVFRLTQVGSTPWVFSAGIERNLRAWIRALYRACGRDDVDQSMRLAGSRKGGRPEKKQKRKDMKVFSTTIEEMEEGEEEEEDEGKEKKNSKILDQEKRGDNEDNLQDCIDDCKEKAESEIKHKSKIEEEIENESKEEKKVKDKNIIEKEIEGSDRGEADDEITPSDKQKIIAQNIILNENHNTVQSSPEDVEENIYEENTYDVEENIYDRPEDKTDTDNDEITINVPVSPTPSDESTSTNTLIRRKETKRRIKILRWLKKTVLGTDDVAIIGDIYKVEGSNSNYVKLWCLVRNKQLYCYRNIMDDRIDMVIPLNHCRAVPINNSSSKEFKFHIEKNNENLCTFVAKSDKERARWIQIVRNRRGTVLLREYNEHAEYEETEEGVESAGSEESDEFTESDEDDDGGYVIANSAAQPYVVMPDHDNDDDDDPEYAKPFERSDDEEEKNSGYVSVLTLEYEFTRQKSRRKTRKYNPNVTSKTDFRNLTENTCVLNAMINRNLPASTLRQNHQRLPAPLPKTSACSETKVECKNIDDMSPGVKNRTEQEPRTVDELQECISSPESSVHGGLQSEQLSDQDSDDNKKKTFHDNSSKTENGSTSTTNSEGIITDCKMTASSWLQDSPPSQGKLGQSSTPEMTGAWRPEINDKNQFLEIDLGQVITVSAIGIQGRPDYNENGGEYVKSFTLFYSTTRETWMAYKTRGKVKVFQGCSGPHQELKKSLRYNITSRYFRVCPHSWHNHVALRVALYKGQVNVEANAKSKASKKKDKIKSIQADSEKPPNGLNSLKRGLKKKDISSPIFQRDDESPAGESLSESLKGGEDQVFFNVANELSKPLPDSDNLTNGGSQSLESRIKLRETLLTKEKKEQIVVLEGLKKRLDYAKDKMIVMNNSSQHKSDAFETEEEYCTVKLELVKVKKRLIDIETEMRELRLFAAHHREEREEQERPKDFGRPSKPPLTRRPSKEIKVCPDMISPVVNPETFNSPGDLLPARKVKDNVKMFENLYNKEVFLPGGVKPSA